MDVRTSAARAVRRVLNWEHVPRWAVNTLRRVAHQLKPHSLTCRFCGATFTAADWRSARHADRAYDHYVTQHASDLYGFPMDTWAVSRAACGEEFDRWLERVRAEERERCAQIAESEITRRSYSRTADIAAAIRAVANERSAE